MPNFLTIGNRRLKNLHYNVTTHFIYEKEDMLKKVSEELAQETFSDVDGSAAIDIGTIRSIADIIFELIERCRERREADSVVEAITDPGFVQRAAVRRSVRRHLSRQEYRSRGRKLAENILDKGNKASEEDALKLIDEIDRN